MSQHDMTRALLDAALLDKYGNNIAAMQEALEYYEDDGGQRYAIFLAQMQSGKTMAYRLLACEMLRKEMVAHVVIFSGTSDKDLKGQTDINLEMNEAESDKFIDLYIAYLKSIRVLVDERSRDWVQGLFKRIKVVWGTQKKHYNEIKKDNTFYIWEESHYAQTQGQGVDNFLRVAGIDARGGCSAGNYVLSVSATPFSEMADAYNPELQQTKKIIRWTPGEGYVGIKSKYDAGDILPYDEDGLPKILKKYDRPGYIIMRAPEEMAERVEAHFKGWRILRCDMKNPMDLNAVLKKVPEQKTVIFVKGMLRMGKVLEKKHIMCVFETGSKTDTILQGLLGRCCGYYREHIVVYIKNYNETEIVKFIRMSEGERYIPSNGTNVKKSQHKKLFPCIPLKLSRVDCVHGERIWEDICPNIREARSADELVIYRSETENDSDTFWNSNTRVPEMRRRIKDVMFNAHQATSGGSIVVHREETKAKWIKKMRSAYGAYGKPKRENNFEEGNEGGCGAGGAHHVVVWEESDEFLYITMQFPYDAFVDEPIPDTTGKEVFCCEPEPYVHGGFVMNVGRLTRENPGILDRELRRFIQLSRDYDADKRITKNGTNPCIHLTPGVFAELAGIKERLQADGVLLGWKKKTGRIPADTKDPTDVRLSEINWRFE